MPFETPTHVTHETIDNLKGAVAELRAEVLAVRERLGNAESQADLLLGVENEIRAIAKDLREKLERHQDEFAPAVVDAIVEGFATAGARRLKEVKAK